MSTKQEDMFKNEILDFGMYSLGSISDDIKLEDIVLPLLSPPMLHDETTLDAVTKYPNTNPHEFPYSPLGPPDRTDFSGDLNFTVEVNSRDTHRKKYLYSHKLNRIYVDIKCNFPVQFNWSTSVAQQNMFVRATVVFSDQSQCEKRVERCLQHTHENTNASLNQTIVKNVLHSARELNTQGVFYCGDSNVPDSWFSVLVQLSTATEGVCNHAYQFVCKNSCSTGINRRAIEIIFTLEDVIGNVYGRQTVGARVCACPRRDMQKDEETEAAKNGKRRVTNTNPTRHEPKSKKIKLEAVPEDGDLVPLPQISLVGSRSVITGLEVMLSMQEQAASLKKNDPPATEKYSKAIAELKTAIEQLKSKVTQ